MSGGSCGDDVVAVDVLSPTRRLLGVVAGLAQPLPVADVRRAEILGRPDVIGVPDRCVAPRCAAGLVAKDQEASLQFGEGASTGLYAGKLSCAVDVETP